MSSKARYLFLYGVHKKKVEMEVAGEGAKLPQLRVKAQELFALKNFLLQICDRDFNEWVDIGEEEVVPTNTKVLVQCLKASESNSNLCRFLFLYGVHKKKVEIKVEREGAGAKVSHLKMKAQEIFGLENVLLQIWDTDFDEWVDIEEDQFLPTNTKVLVQYKDSECNFDSCSWLESEREDVETPSPPSYTTPSFTPSKSPAMPVTPSTPLTIPSSYQVQTSQGDMQCKNWHLGYKLPHLPPSVSAKLNTGQLLKEAEKSAVLDAIYNSVKPFTYYPTASQYESIIKMFLNEYPKMWNQPNMTAADVMSLWKCRLQYKFRNARKREDSSIPVVACKKRKISHGAGLQSLSQIKAVPPQWGIINYLPPRPESEDEGSIRHHISWMKMERLKKEPHYERVKEGMSATLSDRRKMIITDGASVTDVKEAYPWLFEEDEMLAEFQRLEGSHTMDEILNAGLEKYAEAIVKCAKALKKRPELLERAIERASSQIDEKSKKEYYKCAAVLGVPALVNERVENMLVMSEEAVTDLPVCMRVTQEAEDKEREYSVFVDSMKVSSSENFLSGFANYLAVFYCLNLAYPSTLKKSLQFYQKVILNIQDNLPIEKSVLKILDKINMHLSVEPITVILELADSDTDNKDEESSVSDSVCILPL